MSGLNPQRESPFGRLTPRRVWHLSLDQIDPVIHLVHRRQGAYLNIAPRIILDHEFVLVLAGSGRFVFGRTVLHFSPHQLFMIPPFVPHRIESDPPAACDHVAVHFDFALGVPALKRQLEQRTPYEVRFAGGQGIPRQLQLLANERLERGFLDLVKLVESREPWHDLAMRGCFCQILADAFQKGVEKAGATHSPGKLRNFPRIERAIDHANRHLEGPLTPASLARIAGLSGSHFNRLFRSWTGYSPLEYLRRQRVERARQLLADVGLSIKEIAARTGFKDPFHFSKSFRQLVGLSPSEFRAAVLAGKRA